MCVFIRVKQFTDFISVLLWYLTLLFVWGFLQLSFSITVIRVFYLNLSYLPLVIDSLFSPACAGSGPNEGRLFNRMSLCIVWLWRRRTLCQNVSLLSEVCGLNPPWSTLSLSPRLSSLSVSCRKNKSILFYNNTRHFKFSWHILSWLHAKLSWESDTSKPKILRYCHWTGEPADWRFSRSGARLFPEDIEFLGEIVVSICQK